MANVTVKGEIDVRDLAHSPELSSLIREVAEPVFEAAKQDPNPTYVASLRFYEHHSRGRRGRVSWRIGAAPVIGARVESLRGTLARALGRIG